MIPRIVVFLSGSGILFAASSEKMASMGMS
jgi:hypothetical protein